MRSQRSAVIEHQYYYYALLSALNPLNPFFVPQKSQSATTRQLALFIAIDSPITRPLYQFTTEIVSPSWSPVATCEMQCNAIAMLPTNYNTSHTGTQSHAWHGMADVMPTIHMQFGLG